MSPRAPVQFFDDREIVAIATVQGVDERESVRIVRTEFGQLVVQQVSLNGCTAAASAMLILAHRPNARLGYLRSRTLARDLGAVADDIRAAGLVPLQKAMTSSAELVAAIQEIDARVFSDEHRAFRRSHREQADELERAWHLERRGVAKAMRREFVAFVAREIGLHGPAVVGIGGHVIVVDAIDPVGETALIRDPYHGWQIRILLSALESRISIDDGLVQVASAAHAPRGP